MKELRQNVVRVLTQCLFVAFIANYSGIVVGDDWTAPPVPPALSWDEAPKVPEPGDQLDQGEVSDISVPGSWVEASSTPKSQSAPEVRDIPITVKIEWSALEQSAIDTAIRENTSAVPLVGLPRQIPMGYRGNLFEKVRWTDVRQRKMARIQVSAEEASSVRVEFLVSLPAGSSLTFLGTYNEEVGHSPPVWTQSELVARSADSRPVWGPSGAGGELGVVVDVPTNAELDGHFLVFEKISHSWISDSATSTLLLTSKHGSTLECPDHYQMAACHTSQFPSGDKIGTVVHIHYQRDGQRYVCSGTMLTQRRGSSQIRLRPLLLTAHHCIGNAETADTIETTHHYYVASDCERHDLDDRYFTTHRGAVYLKGSRSADQTLLELRPPLQGRYWLSGWDRGWNPSNSGSDVYGLHHPKGHPMAFSQGSAGRRIDVNVIDYGTVLDAIPVSFHIGAVERGSSGSGLFLANGKDYLVGVLSGGSLLPSGATDCDGPSYYGSFQDFFPLIREFIDPEDVSDLTKEIARIPYFLRGSVTQQAFLYLVNSSDVDATVVVSASDNLSSQLTIACRFRIPPRSTRTINSNDLQSGNSAKGCNRAGGSGGGAWSLQIRSDVRSVQTFVYARALDGSGFLNNLGGTAKEVASSTGRGRWYFLHIVNPASNVVSRSTVRITNIGKVTASNIQFVGFDASGVRYPRTGRMYLKPSLRPNHTIQLTSRDLEQGNVDKLTDSFGDGTGKWKLWVYSPSVPLEVTSLLSSQGLTTNLSR